MTGGRITLKELEMSENDAMDAESIGEHYSNSH